MDAAAAARPSLGRQSWTFARHFLEMCVSMCAGGAILSLIIFRIPVLIGAPNPRGQLPELALILIAIRPDAADGGLDAVPRHGVAAHS